MNIFRVHFIYIWIWGRRKNRVDSHVLDVRTQGLEDNKDIIFFLDTVYRRIFSLEVYTIPQTEIKLRKF